MQTRRFTIQETWFVRILRSLHRYS